MEIDHGQFEREIEIPSGFDQSRITTEWDNGLLWIYLPPKASRLSPRTSLHPKEYNIFAHLSLNMS